MAVAIVTTVCVISPLLPLGAHVLARPLNPKSFIFFFGWIDNEMAQANTVAVSHVADCFSDTRESSCY